LPNDYVQGKARPRETSNPRENRRRAFPLQHPVRLGGFAFRFSGGSAPSNPRRNLETSNPRRLRSNPNPPKPGKAGNSNSEIPDDSDETPKPQTLGGSEATRIRQPRKARRLPNLPFSMIPKKPRNPNPESPETPDFPILDDSDETRESVNGNFDSTRKTQPDSVSSQPEKPAIPVETIPASLTFTFRGKPALAKPRNPRQNRRRAFPLQHPVRLGGFAFRFSGGSAPSNPRRNLETSNPRRLRSNPNPSKPEKAENPDSEIPDDSDETPKPQTLGGSEATRIRQTRKARRLPNLRFSMIPKKPRNPNPESPETPDFPILDDSDKTRESLNENFDSTRKTQPDSVSSQPEKPTNSR